jgi:hypothetical protein
MKVHVQRYKHLGEGMHKDLKTGKIFDEEHREQKKQFKIIGEIDPNKFR